MADEVTLLDHNGNEITVVTSPITAEETEEPMISKPVEISNQILPPTGTVFSIGGVMYKVTYVNNGRNRFSASPVR
jgi:hypothetical protein